MFASKNNVGIEVSCYAPLELRGHLASTHVWYYGHSLFVFHVMPDAPDYNQLESHWVCR